MLTARIGIGSSGNDSFGVEVVPDAFETVGGFVSAVLGKIPRAGDEVDLGTNPLDDDTDDDGMDDGTEVSEIADFRSMATAEVNG